MRRHGSMVMGLAVCLLALQGAGAHAGVVDYWAFDADIAAGNPIPGDAGNYVGNLVGDAYTSGGYLVLDGAGDYIQLPDISGGHFGDQAATLSLWMRLNNATPTDGSRTGFVGLGNQGNTHLPWTDGQAYIGPFRTSRIDNVILRPDVPRDDWFHVAVTTEPGSGNYRIYQNGQEIRTADPSFAVRGNPTIGRSGDALYLDGMMDEVVILDHSLPAFAVQGLANRTLTIEDVGALNPGGLGVIGTLVKGAELVNVAPGGTATQISDGWGGTADRAIDDNTDGQFWNNSVTHTQDPRDYQPWWQVDLSADFTVDQISLWNRTDCCGDRLTNFRVSILNSSMTEVWGNDFFTTGGFPNPDFDIAVPGVDGRHVRVQLYGTEYLSLAEVQVFEARPGDFALDPDGILGIDLDGLTKSSDLLIVDGQLTIAGELRVYLIDGALEVGDLFNILDWNTGVTGTFSSMSLPELEQGLFWSLGHLYTDGTIGIVIPEPASLSLLGLGLLALARRRRR